MGHLSFILCLVVSLLACPFQCMSGLTQPQGDSTCVLVAEHCECCPHHDNSDVPTLPCSDDECCDCVCDGAVLNSHESLGIDHESPRFSATDFDLVPILGASGDGLNRGWDEVSSPPPQRGRALRLALHSLQV